MKLSKFLVVSLFSAFVGSANAADITIYYSPTCPHCHHAREFIESTLIYEYDDLKVTTVNVMTADNRQEFFDTIKKCEYESGGVPVLVVGEKCFQGFGESTKDELRTAIEADLTDEQKQSAASNKAQLAKDRDAFVATHSDRTNAVSEKDTKKKLNKGGTNTSDILLYVFLGLLVLGMCVVLFKRKK